MNNKEIQRVNTSNSTREPSSSPKPLSPFDYHFRHYATVSPFEIVLPGRARKIFDSLLKLSDPGQIRAIGREMAGEIEATPGAFITGFARGQDGPVHLGAVREVLNVASGRKGLFITDAFAEGDGTRAKRDQAYLAELLESVRRAGGIDGYLRDNPSAIAGHASGLMVVDAKLKGIDVVCVAHGSTFNQVGSRHPFPVVRAVDPSEADPRELAVELAHIAMQENRAIVADMDKFHLCSLTRYADEFSVPSNSFFCLDRLGAREASMLRHQGMPSGPSHRVCAIEAGLRKAIQAGLRNGLRSLPAKDIQTSESQSPYWKGVMESGTRTSSAPIRSARGVVSSQ